MTEKKYPLLLRDISCQIARERGLYVIELSANVKMKSDFDYDYQASPQEFLGYFLNADFVVTTSFHGTAFSIIMRKQFVTILLGGSVDDRAKSLLYSFGLEGRTVKIDDTYSSIMEDINYNDYDGSIESLCEQSVLFLEKVTEGYNEKSPIC